MKLTIHTDGAARGNPGPASIGVIIFNQDHKVLYEYKKKIGETTNNVAEYKALIRGLELASQYTNDEVVCYMDSELMAKQLNYEYKVKAEHLKELFEKVNKLSKNFKKISFRHVRREDKFQKEADRLANEALDN